jgi:enolase
MSKVVKIVAYETIHYGGAPTVTAKMTLDNGCEVKASVSTNKHNYSYQSTQLLDNDPERYQGEGVLRAVHYINTLIAPKLAGVSPTKQNEVDGWLLAADGTADKSKLGVNTIYAISSLFIKAGAQDSGMPIYKYVNAAYNSRHPETAVKVEKVSSPIIPLISRDNFANFFDFKEFCVAPSSSYPFSKSLEMAMRIHLGTVRSLGTANVTGNADVMEYITKTIEGLNYRLASDIFLALNFGASSYARGNSYTIKDKSQSLKQADYIEFIAGLTKKYFPLFLIDPLIPDDTAGWKALGQSISNDAYMVGDDLVASNASRVTKVLTDKICSSYLLKPPEVGTITEVFELVNLSRKNSLNYIFSTSQSESNDSLLADLSVGLGADFVKLGLPTTGENFSKYNRMTEIESEILNVKK